jgi:hypothetical protein
VDTASVSDDGEGGDEAMNEKMLEVADLSSGKGIIKGRKGRPPKTGNPHPLTPHLYS